VGSRGASSVLFAATELPGDPARDAVLAAMRPWAIGMTHLNFMGVEDAHAGIAHTLICLRISVGSRS
jgi:hypothetical protein